MYPSAIVYSRKYIRKSRQDDITTLSYLCKIFNTDIIHYYRKLFIDSYRKD